MIKEEHLELFEVGTTLRDAVQGRIESGNYSDAMLAAFRYLTDILRERSGEDGDGSQLVGKALGGNAPSIRLNDLQSQSELDEQRGMEQLLRGLYVGIRNTRTHEHVEDSLSFALRVIVFIDTIADILGHSKGRFDVQEFAERIYEPYFAATPEYAEVLVSQVPRDRRFEAFCAAFSRRSEGDVDKLKVAFWALFQTMDEEALVASADRLSDALRIETSAEEIGHVLQLMKPDMWRLLDDDVRLRLEEIMLSDCAQGSFDAYGGLRSGELGAQAATFGRYFDGRSKLCSVLSDLLRRSWYTQNYVGVYFMTALPSIAMEEGERESIVDGLAYAMIVNGALRLQQSFLRYAQNYPVKWKQKLRISIQAQSAVGDRGFATKALEALGSDAVR